MQNKLIIQRIPQLMIGLFLCGFGLAFTIEAGLGLNSWDVFHDGFSKLIGVKITKYTIPITIGAIILPNNSPNFIQLLFNGVKIFEFSKPNIKKIKAIEIK